MITSLDQLKAYRAEKRAKALHDAQVRARRTAILEILYKHYPKQKDNKDRTDIIINIAADIEQYLNEAEEKPTQA